MTKVKWLNESCHLCGKRLNSWDQRICKALGYRRIFTYTRQSESGTSLKASNWTCDGNAGGTHWTGKRYAEQIEMPLDELKIRWHKDL